MRWFTTGLWPSQPNTSPSNTLIMHNELKLRYRNALPDKPRWVETRDLLAWSDSSCIGDDCRNFVVWSGEDDLGAIVGEPAPTAIHAAAKACEELLAFPEHIHYARKHLQHFDAELATLFKAPTGSIPEPGHPCRVLTRGEVVALSHLQSELRDELADVETEGQEILAALDGDLPVSFAYVASETETLWDISIDTVATHRRRGFASAAVLSMMQIMAQRSQTAVWGAVQSNTASQNLARKLGFIEVDQLWVLNRKISTILPRN